MTYEAKFGRLLFAACFVALGVQGLAISKFVTGLEPIPKAFAMPWAWISGVVLIAAGLSLAAERTARVGALVVAGLLAASATALHGPLMVGHPVEDADALFHVLAIGCGAMALAISLSEGAWTAPAGLAVRLAFGVATIGHGVMHFLFFKFSADFIPAWIPWHAFWAGATGAAQIAAGLAILANILARPAALATGLMYLSWVPLVHIPRTLATPAVPGEWTDIGVCAVLAAATFLVAGILGRPTAPASPRPRGSRRHGASSRP